MKILKLEQEKILVLEPSISDNLYKDKLTSFNPLFLVTILILFLVNSMMTNNILTTFGSENKINESDFIIRDFGIGDDGNPFLVVEGTAGGTIPQVENTALLYIFVTDDGTYGVMSDYAYNKWHSHGITLDDNNCIISMNNRGGVDVNDMIKLTKTNATKVDKILTAEFAMSNPDASICPTKIFDSAP